MTDTSNARAWAYFIASALFAVLAWLLDSFVIVLFSNLLFFCALVYVTIHYAHRRRLGYFGCLLSLLAIGLAFTGHPVAGLLLFVWAFMAVVVDAIQNRRWWLLGVVALPVLGGAVLVAVLGVSVLRALRPASAPRADANVHPAEVAVATMTSAPEPEPPAPERQLTVIASASVGEHFEPVTPLEPQPPPAPRDPTPEERAVAQQRLKERRALVNQFRMDRIGLTRYHAPGCPEAASSPVSGATARLAHLTPHSCINARAVSP
jgi:hypothetical protein